MKTEYKVMVTHKILIEVKADSLKEAETKALTSFGLGVYRLEDAHTTARAVQLVLIPETEIEEKVLALDRHFRSDGLCGFCGVAQNLGHSKRCPFVTIYDYIAEHREEGES